MVVGEDKQDDRPFAKLTKKKNKKWLKLTESVMNQETLQQTPKKYRLLEGNS